MDPARDVPEKTSPGIKHFSNLSPYILRRKINPFNIQAANAFGNTDRKSALYHGNVIDRHSREIFYETSVLHSQKGEEQFLALPLSFKTSVRHAKLVLR